MYAIFLTSITSIVTGIMVYILQMVIRENMRLKKRKEEETESREKAIETGVRQLLSVRLEEIYDQYIRSGTIPRRTYDRWFKLHTAYKDLNGNGTFDHMKKEMENLHID